MAYGTGPGDFVELIDEINRATVQHVSLSVKVSMFRAVAPRQAQFYAVRMEVEHERSLHLAGVAEAAEFGFAHGLNARRGKGPIRSKHELHFGIVAFEFAQGRAHRHVVAAVAIEQENFLAAHLHDRMAELDDHLDVGHLANAERAGEKKVMRGMARPERRQAKDLARSLFLNPERDGSDEVGVGRERQVRAMLFKGAERKKDDFIGRFEPFNFRPGQIFEEHKRGPD